MQDRDRNGLNREGRHAALSSDDFWGDWPAQGRMRGGLRTGEESIWAKKGRSPEPRPSSAITATSIAETS